MPPPKSGTPFKKRVPDSTAPYDAYDESGDTEEKARTERLGGVGGTYDCIALMSDYTVCGDRDDYVRAHPEYVDEQGCRRNR